MSISQKIKALGLLILVSSGIRAQTFVVIPDTQFVVWLHNNLPSAMNGNKLNVNSPLVTSNTHTISVYFQGIKDLSGIQYFSSLKHLDCGKNQITSMPALPGSLLYLSCADNDLVSLPALPSGLITLECSYNHLTNLPSLPAGITSLLCHDNQLISLPALPTSLNRLWCYQNHLTNLPSLNYGLMNIDCGYNSLTSLPSLPATITSISCSHNLLSSLPNLPETLDTIYCNNNSITCFPMFPENLEYLNIENNSFDCLPNYVAALGSDTVSYPLCFIDNKNGCPVNPTILFVPNVFTPNGDDINDEFVIRGEYLADFECRIYNRWGNLVYQWGDIKKGWKGADRNGEICVEGTYFYSISFRNNLGGKDSKGGFVLLAK